MFKIAAFPKCYLKDITEGKISLFDWIEMAEDLQVEGLEFYSGFLTSLDTDYLQKIKDALKLKGFQMPMMCHSPDFTHPDAKERRREVEKQIKMIRVTSILGGRFCRVLSGQRRPEVDESEGIRWVVESIHSCLKEAEKDNVVLVMENHYKDDFWEYPEFAQRKDIFLSIIDKIRSPYFGIQYDPSNAIIAGEDPVDFLQKVKYLVKTMHASDRYLKNETTLEDLKQSDGTLGYSSNLQHGVIGEGIVDYDAIFTILKEINFHGWISIEDGLTGIEEIRKSVEFLKKMQAKYDFMDDSV